MGRRYGLEIEMGDILTHLGARIVYTHQDLNFDDDWWDREIHLTGKVRRYDRWNAVSDGTLKNTNGTRCMMNVMKDGQIVGDTRENRKYRQGLELISPILDFDNFDEDFFMVQRLLASLKLNGAEFKPELRHAFHVHVETPDWGLPEWKKFVAWVLEVQYRLEDVSKAFKSAFPIRKYRREIVEQMQEVDTYEEFWTLYKAHQRVKGQAARDDNFGYRRLVCLGPQLNPLLKIPTVEWRVWPSTGQLRVYKELARFSVMATHEQPSWEFVKEWGERTKKEFYVA